MCSPALVQEIFGKIFGVKSDEPVYVNVAAAAVAAVAAAAEAAITTTTTATAVTATVV